MCVGIKVAALLGSVAGAAAEALEKAAGAQTRPAHSPTGTALGGGGVGGVREGAPEDEREEEEKQKGWREEGGEKARVGKGSDEDEGGSSTNEGGVGGTKTE